MITEWRKLWSTFTPTSDSFPFGFMQLGPVKPDNKSPGFPVIRWHQTADYGFVPNEIMEVSIQVRRCPRATLKQLAIIHPMK